MNSAAASTRGTNPNSIVSNGCGTSESDAIQSTYTLARLAQSANALRMNNQLEQLRNLDLYSRLLPTLESTSTAHSGSITTTGSDVDLLTRLLYRDALNNAKDHTPPLSLPYHTAGRALTPLQRLLQQQVSPIPNSVLSSSPSILEAARLALIRQQLQQQEQQRSSILSNIISNSTNTANTDLLALRLALASGYTSVDQFLRDVTLGQDAPLAGSGSSNHSNSTGSS
jgi:hypothetical protein